MAIRGDSDHGFEAAKLHVEQENRIIAQDRDVLFENEKFAIGVAQAVSGGALVAVIAQIDNLRKLTYLTSIYWFITLAIVSLALSVLAAYFKHQYKMWDVKSRVVHGDERIDRAKRSSAYLDWMRRMLAWSVVAILAAFVILAASFWTHLMASATP